MPQLSPEELERRVLHEGDGVLAVDKPPDLPTSGRTLADPDCLQAALLARAARRGGGFVWAVHQLDADTSGVNLFTTRREAVEPLKQALGDPHSEKRYLALVHGAPAFARVRCAEPLGEVAPGRLGVTPAGRGAVSDFEVLARGPGHAALAVRITTGRTHQIRLHLGHLGHPLVGEGWYRAPPCDRHPRQALHAARLVLPTFGLDLAAPVPEDLARLARELGLGDAARWHGAAPEGTMGAP